MGYFSAVSKEDALPVSSLRLGFETYRKQRPFPWPPFFLSKLNLDAESWWSGAGAFCRACEYGFSLYWQGLVLLPIKGCFGKWGTLFGVLASCLKIWLSSSFLCKIRSLGWNHSFLTLWEGGLRCFSEIFWRSGSYSPEGHAKTHSYRILQLVLRAPGL